MPARTLDFAPPTEFARGRGNNLQTLRSENYRLVIWRWDGVVSDASFSKKRDTWEVSGESQGPDDWCSKVGKVLQAGEMPEAKMSHCLFPSRRLKLEVPTIIPKARQIENFTDAQKPLLGMIFNYTQLIFW